MQFKDLDIKPNYDSKNTDVYNDFFNTVLPQSNRYRRYAGFFSVKRFALIAEGLQEFIQENNGTIEVAIIPTFSQEDKDAIINGNTVDDIVTKNWISDLSQIKEKFLEDHTKALSWMIANGFLTVKLVIPEHEDGIPFSGDELRNHAIFRKEIGIFYNKNNDNIPISFHGIIDRDDFDGGEMYSINVSRYWFESEKDRVNKDHEDFVNFWDDDVCTINSIRCKITSISDEMKEYFKKNAPRTKADIPKLKKLPILRDYQNAAIDSWVENKNKGIFEMATGTGKTFTAIGCIEGIKQTSDHLLIIIATPYRNLTDQWKRELDKWDIKSSILESGTWEKILHDEIFYLNRKSKKETTVFITSHSLFAKMDFIKQIKRSKIPMMLIVDEAHHAGAITVRNGLLDEYDHRLGLSATIERYFDGDGTELLRKYFEGPSGKSTVVTYSLKQAIEDGRLCRYNYYPFFVDLTNEQAEEYQEITYRAVRLLHSKDPEIKKKGELLIMERAKIIRDAENKINALKQIFEEMNNINHTLIFCSENQYEPIKSLLNNPAKYNISKDSVYYKKITYDDPKDPKKRIKILNDFADGDWNVLLSNRVLDEGMDVPQAKNCIVMASTGNPTQFIQRRGRVLRTYFEPYKDGTIKDHANIYDILVKPNLNIFVDQDSQKMEIGIIRSQLSRLKQMGELALNKDYCMNKIQEFTQGLPEEFFELDEEYDKK